MMAASCSGAGSGLCRLEDEGTGGSERARMSGLRWTSRQVAGPRLGTAVGESVRDVLCDPVW